MRVSWQDHSIEITLDRSRSAIIWLQKNIATMKRLSLVIKQDLPAGMLQDLMAVGR
jgi:hypothetical protein